MRTSSTRACGLAANGWSEALQLDEDTMPVTRGERQCFDLSLLLQRRCKHLTQLLGRVIKMHNRLLLLQGHCGTAGAGRNISVSITASQMLATSFAQSSASGHPMKSAPLVLSVQ